MLTGYRNPVCEFFKYFADKDKSECSICNKLLTGKHAANLERHVARHHPKEYAVLQEKKKNCTNKRCSDNSETITLKKQMLLDTFTNPKILRIDMTERKLLDSCVELVTVNGRPFPILSDSGFRKIINPIIVVQ